MDPTRKQLFLIELSTIFKKYGVSISVYDNYDGEDSWCGSDISIEGEDIDIDILDLEKEIQKVVGAL